MRNYHFIIVILITSLIVNVACLSQKKAIIVPFDVSKATYFSWVVNENEKGTTVEITLDHVAPQVQFDSLIFRKVMLPVRILENGDNHILTAILPVGKKRLPVETQFIDKPDQIIFYFNGKREARLLEHISREKMVYYHKSP